MILQPCFEFKAARVKAGYKTQGDLAKATGISLSRISDIERGGVISVPRPDTVDILSKTLGVSKAELLSWLLTYLR